MAIYTQVTSGSLNTITFQGKTGIRRRLFQIVPSFNATPASSAYVSVEFDGVEKFRQYRGGEQVGHPVSFISDGWAAEIGASIAVILTSGSTGVGSALAVEYTGGD